MSLTDLQTLLQAQLEQGGAVTISAATLSAANLVPSDGLDATLEASLNLAAPLKLRVTGTIAAPSAKQLDVSGTASFLGLDNAPVQLSFTTGADGRTDVLIVATLTGWSFATSFPMLIGPPFDDLPASQPCFLVTTAAQTDLAWEPQQPPLILRKGLNFACLLAPSGPLALLQTLISGTGQTTEIVLAGTIDPGAAALTTGCPAISLAGTIDGTLVEGLPFHLGSPQILIASAADENGRTVYPLSLAATLSVGGEPFSTLQAAIIPGSSSFSLAMVPTDNVITPAQIVDLIGGTEFTQLIPGPLESLFSAVGLTSLGATIDLATLAVSALSATIGTAPSSSWTVGPFTLEGMALNCFISTPFAATKAVAVNFSATAKVFPSVFDGVFEFEIASDGGDDLTIAGNFRGAVQLKQLLDGASGGTIELPEALSGIEFDDFGISVTKADGGYDWQLYGAAEALFAIPLDTGTANLTLQAVIASTRGKTTYRLVGGLQIGDEFFDAELDLGAEDVKLTAAWTAAGAPLEFRDVASAFGWDSLTIPPDLDLGLTSAALVYDFTAGSLAFGAKSKTYGQLAFVTLMGQPPNPQRLYAASLATGKSFSLADLPLVGSEFDASENVSVSGLQILFARTPITDPATVASFNALVGQLGDGFPALPAQGAAAPVLASASLAVGGDVTPLTVALGSPAWPPPAPSASAGAAAAPPPGPAGPPGPPPPAPATTGGGASDAATWIDVQRSFGPLAIERIGASYRSDSQALLFEVDADLTFGGITLSLDGLGIGSPLTSFDPVFTLSGLGLAYDEPPVEISGALLRLPADQLAPGTELQFDGTLIVKASDFTLAAAGSYAQQSDGGSSLFIFADVETVIGGPPAFFITGLMAGLGYNRLLRTPAQDEVLDFPLLKLAGGATTAASVLDILEGRQPATGAKAWIAPSTGRDWAAVGVSFTSFELVYSKALLIVEFGKDFQATLLGLSTMSLPQGAPSSESYVYAELELEAVLKPQEGFFGLTAILTNNSYVLTPDCHLTGGFAFSVWYGPSDHAGQFVLTLGGYHPSFQPPSYFPNVPRLGFNWAVSDDVTIAGDAYFALTTSVAMGGGGLEVLFHDGDLNAWFTAHADFLISWHPFFFVGDIDVSIGVSYRLNLLFCHKTISVSVGASVHIYGPPTGGTVHVELWIVSFSVDFGASEGDQKDKPLGWDEFAALLPPPGTAVQINVEAGLMKKLDGGEDGAGLWVVRSGNFRFHTRSAVPASALAFGSADAGAGDGISIRPMDLDANIASVHRLTLSKQQQPASPPQGAPADPGKPPPPVWKELGREGWGLTPLQAAVPESLWGAPPKPFSQRPTAPAANLLPASDVGWIVAGAPPTLSDSRGLVALSALAEEQVAAGGAPISPTAAATASHLPAPASGSIADIAAIAASPAADARGALFALLSAAEGGGAPAYAGTNGNLSSLADRAAHLFSDSPMEVA